MKIKPITNAYKKNIIQFLKVINGLYVVRCSFFFFFFFFRFHSLENTGIKQNHGGIIIV